MRSKSEEIISNKVDMIITFTEHEKRWLIEHFKANEKKIKIIYPGVDKNKFHSINKIHYNEKNRRFKLDLLFVGRNESIKGLDVLINSLRNISKNYKWRLNVVGGEYIDSELIAIKNKLGADKFSNSINFIPSVSHTKLYEYYDRSDLLVVPSYYESFGLVALESMACSTPVIASNVGGLGILIKSGYNGFLFEAGDEYNLSKIIISMYLKDGHPDWKRIEYLSKNALVYSESFLGINQQKKLFLISKN